MAGERSQHDSLGSLCRLAVRLHDASFAAIYHFDEDAFHRRAAAGSAIPAALPAELAREDPLVAASNGFAELLLLPQLGSDPRLAGHPLGEGSGGAGCLALQPVRSPAGTLLGFLMVGAASETCFGCEAAVALADLAATAAPELQRPGPTASWKRLFEKTPHPTLVCDPTTFEIAAVNDAAVSLYGYPREEFLRLTLKDIRPEETVPAFKAIVRKMALRKGTVRHAVHQKKDGTTFFAEIEWQPCGDDDRPLGLAVVRPLDRDDVVHSDLIDQAERYRTFFVQSPDPIVVVAEEDVVDFNNAALQLFGLDPQARAVPLQLGHLMVADDRARFDAYVEQVDAGNQRFAFDDVGFHTVSGERLALECTIQPILYRDRPALQLGFHDISAHVQDVALRGGQNRLLEMIAADATLPEVFEAVTDFAEEQLVGARAATFCMDEDATHMWLISAPSMDKDHRRLLAALEANAAEGPCARAVATGDVVILDDAGTDHTMKPGPFLQSTPYQACWAAPVHSQGDQVQGLLALYFDHPRRAGDHDRKLIDILVHLLEIQLRRHESKKALNESDERWSLLVENQPDAIIITANTVIQYANAAAAKLVGAANSQELVGESVLGIAAPADHPSLRERTLQVQNEGVILPVAEYRITDGEGHERFLEVRSLPITYQGRRAVQSVVHDVTEKKQAIEALRRSEQRFRSLIEQASDMIVTAQPHGKYVEVNSRACEMMGYTREELLQMRPEDIMTEESLAIRPAAWDEYEPGKTYRFEREFRRKDGTTFPAELSVSIVGDGYVQAIVRDISRRKRVEEEIQHLKAFYEHTLNVLPIEVAVMDAQGRYLYLNPAAVSDGEMREWLIGKTSLDYARARGLDTELFEKRHAFQEEVVATKQMQQIEEPFVTTDGEQRYVIRAVLPILNQKGEVSQLVGYGLDITDRRRAEEAVSKSQAFLETVIEHIPNMLFVKDAGDLRYVQINKALEELLGMPRSELLGKSDFELFPPQEAAFFTVKDQQVLERGELVDIREELVSTPDHGTRIVHTKKIPIFDEHGNPEYLLGISEDVTETKEAELALRESENRYRSLIEQASDGIIIGTQEGGMVEVNSRACEMLGYSREELMHMRAEDLVAPDAEGEEDTVETPRKTGPIDWQALEEGQVLIFERTMIRKDGSTFPAESSVKLIGKNLVQSILRDISDRKQFENELIASKEKAEEMNRLKSAFLANMSHEIRTPLTSIIGFADVLAEEVSAQNREFVNLIGKSGQRLMETLNSVLDLAQLEGRTLELRPEVLVVADRVKESLDVFRPQAHDKGLTLQFERVDQCNPLIHTDRGALNRILGNLISNAIKFTREGAITVRIATDDGHVHIHVEDTGVGISTPFLPRIFDEFKQESSGLARNFEGSGLGLTITKRLTELLGGTIDVASEKGVGSTFTVVFPRYVAAEADAAPPDEEEEAPAHGHRRRILAVEDDPNNRALIAHLLANIHELEVAADGETGLALAEGDAFDLILLDINLGSGMNGEEVLEALRRRPTYADTPIIAMTAYSLPGDRSYFLNSGFDAYVSKPFTRSQLLRALEPFVQPSQEA